MLLIYSIYGLQNSKAKFTTRRLPEIMLIIASFYLADYRGAIECALLLSLNLCFGSLFTLGEAWCLAKVFSFALTPYPNMTSFDALVY
jgi:hypothetical protein